ncbi:MAG: PhzF family phenazine biosynthesis protein [Gemmatimonadetes bacterium]|nr:PhzF family phenazine biosynthesis protein [Gemmatimonadota bacterium]
MGQKIIQVDAFTAEPYRGNPAAVCILERAADERWMQDVAREMNLSETAYLSPHADGYGLRWFTPAAEVDLCGHATLASAHVLWEEGHLDARAQARFHTRSGLLTATREDGWILMDFPARPPTPAHAPPELVAALGVQPVYIGFDGSDFLAELESPETMRVIRPDVRLLRGLAMRGLIITTRSDWPGYDFMSRFFAPGVGVDEDPVTGSAHCALGPYWAKKLGRKQLVGYQASERGGIVRVRTAGDRVILGGQAVTVLRGELV